MPVLKVTPEPATPSGAPSAERQTGSGPVTVLQWDACEAVPGARVFGTRVEVHGVPADAQGELPAQLLAVFEPESPAEELVVVFGGSSDEPSGDALLFVVDTVLAAMVRAAPYPTLLELDLRGLAGGCFSRGRLNSLLSRMVIQPETLAAAAGVIIRTVAHEEAWFGGVTTVSSAVFVPSPGRLASQLTAGCSGSGAPDAPLSLALLAEALPLRSDLTSNAYDARVSHLPPPSPDASHLFLGAPVVVPLDGVLGHGAPWIAGSVAWIGSVDSVPGDEAVVALRARSNLPHLYGKILAAGPRMGMWFGCGCLAGARLVPHSGPCQAANVCFVLASRVRLDATNQGVLSLEDFTRPGVARPCPMAWAGCPASFVNGFLTRLHLRHECEFGLSRPSSLSGLPTADLAANQSRSPRRFPRTASVCAGGTACLDESALVRSLGSRFAYTAQIQDIRPATGVWVTTADDIIYLATRPAEQRVLRAGPSASHVPGRARRGRGLDPGDLGVFPPEILELILSFCSPADVARVAQTCRFFAWLVDDPLLWRAVARNTFGSSVVVGPYAMYGGWRTLAMDGNALGRGPLCEAASCGLPTPDDEDAADMGRQAAASVASRLSVGRSTDAPLPCRRLRPSIFGDASDFVVDDATGLLTMSWDATRAARGVITVHANTEGTHLLVPGSLKSASPAELMVQTDNYDYGYGSFVTHSPSLISTVHSVETGAPDASSEPWPFGKLTGWWIESWPYGAPSFFVESDV